jgi:muramidase (phage lysozyme)
MPSGGDDSGRGNGPSGQSSTGNGSTDSSSPGGKGSSSSSGGSSSGGKGASSNGGGYAGGGFDSSAASGKGDAADFGGGSSSGKGGSGGSSSGGKGASSNGSSSGSDGLGFGPSVSGGRGSAAPSTGGFAPAGDLGLGPSVSGGRGTPASSTGGYAPSSVGAGRGTYSGATSTGGFAPDFNNGRFGWGSSSVSSVAGGRGTPSPTTGGVAPSSFAQGSIARSFSDLARSAGQVGVMGIGGQKSFNPLGGEYTGPAPSTPSASITASPAATLAGYGEAANTAGQAGIMGVGTGGIGTKGFDTVGGRYTGPEPTQGRSASSRADDESRIASSRAETMAQAEAREQANRSAYGQFHNDYQQKAGMPANRGLFAEFNPAENGRQVGFTPSAEVADLNKADFLPGQMALSATPPTNFSNVNPVSTSYVTPQTQSVEQSTSMGIPSPSNDSHMATFEGIAKAEGTAGEAGYTTVFGGRQVPGLTDMTIAEARAFGVEQAKANKTSSAIGKPQVITSTLDMWARANNINVNETKFSKKTQNEIAGWLMGERADKASKMPGGLNAHNLGVQLSKEWAGLAGPNGKSQYAKDGVNNAHTSWSETKSIAADYIAGIGSSSGSSQSVSAFNPVGTGYEAATPAGNNASGAISDVAGPGAGKSGEASSGTSVAETPTGGKQGNKGLATAIDIGIGVVSPIAGIANSVFGKGIFGQSFGEYLANQIANGNGTGGAVNFTGDAPLDPPTAPEEEATPAETPTFVSKYIRPQKKFPTPYEKWGPQSFG